LNFLGPGVTAADNPVSQTTDVTIDPTGSAAASIAAVPNKLALRDGAGCTSVGTPTLSTHAATKAYVDALPGVAGYVSAGIYNAPSGAAVVMWSNDTGGARTVGNLFVVPTMAITQSDTDYWTIALALGSAPSTPVQSFTTKVTGGVALVAGTRVAFGGTVTVPDADGLLLRAMPTGSPAGLGLYAQGR
jgi:hypothetical protein